MRPRILFLDHVGELGGVELKLVDVARAFQSTSTVLLYHDGPLRQRLQDTGVRVEVAQGSAALHAVRRHSGWPSPDAAWETLRLAAATAALARQHDVIHANTQKSFVVGCLAGMMARRPVVWDLHDLLVPEHFSATNIRIDVLLAKHFTRRVVANSHASAHALISRGAPADKVRVVYNGIDPAPFDQVSPPELLAAREEFGVGLEPVIGLFGRLAPWKGQEVALEAMYALPGVHLLIVGDALFGEQEYGDRLRRRAAAMGIDDRVHFAGFRSDIPRLMRTVDVVIHTSTSPEPFGRVIVEGMMARRPVIATHGGGVEEIIESDVTGVLVERGNATALADAIRGLLEDRTRRYRLIHAARDMAERRFGVATMVQAMENEFQEMMNA